MRKPILVVALITVALAMWPASAAPATQLQPVSINVDRNFGAGTDLWSSSGAFSDSGTFADDPTHAVFTRTGTIHEFRTFTGADGTFKVRIEARILPSNDPNVLAVSGSWAVVAGTGGYARLEGTGPLAESFNPGAGTVVGTWEGSVHFD